MASVFLNEAKSKFASGDYDWNTDDIRVRLVDTTTTADTENDGIVTLANYTTIGVCDSTGYADVALANEAVNKDDANDRAELDADDVVFSGLGGDATNDIQGCIIYKYVDGTNANDLPIAFVDFTADITSAATQITIPWDAEGILQLT